MKVIMDKDYYVVRDESGAERHRFDSRRLAEIAARALIEQGQATRADVYVVLPDFGLPPHDVESRVAGFGLIEPEPLFPAGAPRRERPSGLAERAQMLAA